MATTFAGFSPRSSGLRPTAPQRTGSRCPRAAEIGVDATVLEALAPDGRKRRTTGGASDVQTARRPARSTPDSAARVRRTPGSTSGGRLLRSAAPLAARPLRERRVTSDERSGPRVARASIRSDPIPFSGAPMHRRRDAGMDTCRRRDRDEGLRGHAPGEPMHRGTRSEARRDENMRSLDGHIGRQPAPRLHRCG
jgi:hypothetical protein